jgi:competence protein ComEC
VLLTGDIEAPGEALLTAWGERLRTEILKVPHHGSRTSSTPGFIGAVRPKIAVASVGMRNPYGHPSSEVIERYTAAGADIYRTDLHGAVIIRIGEHGASTHPFIR